MSQAAFGAPREHLGQLARKKRARNARPFLARKAHAAPSVARRPSAVSVIDEVAGGYRAFVTVREWGCSR
jgi:hypothetical protein